MAGAMMAYNTKANRFVLFGGWDGSLALNGTWVYDPTNRTWMALQLNIYPLARGDGMFVYDPHADLFILFGGWHEEPNDTYTRLSDTWTFSLSGSVWTQQHPGTSPSPRSDAEVAYDPMAGAVLLVGGFNGTEYLGDVWSYNLTADTWTPRTSSLMPTRRADGRMVYVSPQDRFILFGGNDYSGPNFTFHHLADTWSYNWTANVWTNVTSGAAPSDRDYPILAFDPVDGRVLLTTGFGDGRSLNDLWAFDVANNSWAKVDTPVSPPARFAAVGGFSLADGVLVVFSGATDSGILSDTWQYTYGPSTTGTTAPSVALPLAVGAVLVIGLAIAIFLVDRKRRRPEAPQEDHPGNQGSDRR